MKESNMSHGKKKTNAKRREKKSENKQLEKQTAYWVESIWFS